MSFTLEFGGRRYTVKFFRTGMPSEVKVWSERPSPLGRMTTGLWMMQWNSFSRRNPSPAVRNIIALATHLREATLAFNPRFPLMD